MKAESTFLTMLDLADEVPNCELRGDRGHRIDRLVHPAEVAGPTDLCLLMSEAALGILKSDASKHACAIVGRGLAEAESNSELLGRLESYLVVDRPRYALARIGQFFRRQPRPKPGVHPSAVVEAGVELGAGVSIGAGAWIGSGVRLGDRTTVMANVSICDRAQIGEDCWIFPGVYIGHEVEVGDRVIIHPNACLGGDGFAFESAAPSGAEEARKVRVRTGGKSEPLERIESLGDLKIGDDVEIGACTTIDRSTLGPTLIGRGTKIDNLVQIGHGNRIGEDVLLCAQVGLAGSSSVGDGAVLAGKVGVADHRSIGANAVLMAKSGVTRDVPPGDVYYGMPARPVRETLRQYSLIGQLDQMSKRLSMLEAQVKARE